MKNSTKVFLIISILFVLIAIQIHFVWIYFDDYGYAALSYLPDYKGKVGLDTGFQEIISFLVYHYNHWGGRVLWFFLEIILLRIGTPSYRIAQTIVMTGIFFMIYKIITKVTKQNHWKVALASALCFGLIDIYILRDGFYWFTASVLYLLPLFPVFLLVYFLMEKNRKTGINILCIFLAFIAAWSQEQISVLIVSYLALYSLYNYFIEKDKNKWNIAITISAIIGFLILMLAPGTAFRVSEGTEFYSLSIFEKIIRNFPNIIATNFGTKAKKQTALFFLSCIYIMIKNRNKFKRKWILDIGIVNTLLIFITSISTEQGYFNILYGFHRFSALIKLFSIFQVVYIVLLLVIIFYKRKELTLAFLLVAASLSQASMVMAPYFPDRASTMFTLTIYTIFAYVIANLLNNKKFNINLLLIPVLLFSICEYTMNTLGYYRNYPIKVSNDKILRDASKRIKEGEEITEIELEKADDFYGVVEPDGTFYHEKHYYDIPLTVNIHYKEEGE